MHDGFGFRRSWTDLKPLELGKYDNSKTNVFREYRTG